MKSRPSIQKRAQKFEQQIIKLLEEIGFVDVNGGPEFNLGKSSQIDACGGAGNVLVVIDAHTTSEQRRKSIRTKIKALRGERPLIIRGMRQRKRYQKYKDVRLVIATHNIEITQQDKNFASMHPRVYLWDDQLLSYYSKLSKLTGPFAKNDLLSELDVPVSATISESALTIPALKTSLRGRTAYLFYAKPEILLAISYVARRRKRKRTTLSTAN